MLRRLPDVKGTYPLFPYTTFVRSGEVAASIRVRYGTPLLETPDARLDEGQRKFVANVRETEAAEAAQAKAGPAGGGHRTPDACGQWNPRELLGRLGGLDRPVGRRAPRRLSEAGRGGTGGGRKCRARRYAYNVK